MTAENYETYVAQGLTAYSEGRLHDAATAWRLAMAVERQPVQASWYLGQLLHRGSLWTESADVFAVHLQGSPSHAEAWHLYALALRESGRLAEAASAFDRAAGCDGGHPEAARQAAATHDRLRADGIHGRLLVLDPGLANKDSHHFNYASSILRTAQNRGVRTELHCFRGAHADIFTEYGAQPTFTQQMGYSRHLGPPSTVVAMVRQNFIIKNRFVYDDLAALTESVMATDVLFFPSLLQTELLGIAQWLESLPEVKRPRVVILLRYWHFDAADVGNVQDLFRLCFSMLSHPRLRVRLCSDTRELCTLYGEMANRPLDLVGIPHMPVAPSGERFVAEGHQRPVIGYLGTVSSAKGFHFLPGLIAQRRSEGLPGHFLIQINKSFLPPDQARESEQAFDAVKGDDVTLVGETLSESRYNDMLCACDIVLIAYSPVNYRYTSSGVFAEAVAAGKVVVIPDQTATASEARALDAGYSAFDSHTQESVWAALRRAIVDWPSLSAQAEAASVRAKKIHNPDSVMDYLLDHTPAG